MGACIDKNGVENRGGLPTQNHQIINIEEIPKLAIRCGKVVQNLHNMAHGIYGDAYNNPDSFRAWLASIIAGLTKSAFGAEIHQGATFKGIQIAISPTEWSWLGRILTFTKQNKEPLPKKLTVIGQLVVIVRKDTTNSKQQVVTTPKDTTNPEPLKLAPAGIRFYCNIPWPEKWSRNQVEREKTNNTLNNDLPTIVYFLSGTTLGATGETTELPPEIKEQFPDLPPKTRHPIVKIGEIPKGSAVQVVDALGPAIVTIGKIPESSAVKVVDALSPDEIVVK
jgi:hypothetical protein